MDSVERRVEPDDWGSDAMSGARDRQDGFTRDRATLAHNTGK
jgi:hypothetical protein